MGALFCLPLTAQAQIRLYASSKAEWKKLAENSKYRDTEVYVTLRGDFIIDNSVDNWEDFRGTLDGNGHTITVDYNCIDRAPIRNTLGNSLIKNLNIKGNIVNTLGAFSYDEASPLVRYVDKGTLTVQNCHSRVNFQIRDKSDGGNSVSNGGFIGTIEGNHSGYGNAVFDNCSYIGSIKSHETDPGYGKIGARNGGFVGAIMDAQNNKAKLTITNSYSIISYHANDTTGRSICDNFPENGIGTFVGLTWETTDKLRQDYNWKISNGTFSNNYYCGSGDLFIYTKTKDIGTSVSMDEFADGSIAYKLNKGKTGDDAVWLQYLGVDPYPMTSIQTLGSTPVCYAEEVKREATTDKWTTLFYPKDVTLPEGTKKYIVTGTYNGMAQLSEVNSTGTANMPLVLYNAKGFDALTLPALYYNKVDQTSTLRGVYETTAATAGTDYTFDGGKEQFVPATSAHTPWECYLTGDKSSFYSLSTSTSYTVYISSQKAWKSFCDSYGGANVDVYLNTDLTIGKGEGLTKSTFNGTLHGNGHTITLTTPVSSEEDLDVATAFSSFNGSVSHLSVKGPEPGNYLFINKITDSADFTDCLLSNANFYYDGVTPTYSSCLILSTDPDFPDMGTLYNGNGKKIDIKDAEVAGGKAAYLLNNGRTGKSALWVQTIGTDANPVFKAVSPESREVLHVAASTLKFDKEKWTTLCYPADITFEKVLEVRIFDNYTLDGDGNLQANYNVTNTLKANTPAVLYRESGLPNIDLPEGYYNEYGEVDGILQAVSTATPAANLNTLTTEDGTALFKAGAAETLPAWQCYLAAEAKVVNDGTVITSQEDWYTFTKNYINSSEVNVRLLCDVNTSGTVINWFSGTLDGNGHTITINGNPPFQLLQGTVKRLAISGTSDDGIALARQGFDELTIEDCVSTVGAFVDESGEDAGSVTYINCLVAGSDADAKAYVGTVTSTAESRSEGETVTADDVASGAIAFLLNGDRTGSDAPWRQTLGTDGTPALGESSQPVRVAAETVKIGTAGWATHYYPVDSYLPEGVRAYSVSGVELEDGDYVVQLKQEKDTIPALTPVLLCSLGDEATEAEKTITIDMPKYYYNTITAKEIEDNGQAFRLFGVTKDTESFDGCYVLQQHTDAAGKTHTAFYRVDESEACPVVPAWKCALLDINTFADSEDGTEEKTQAVHLRLDKGESTSISAINRILDEDAATYDLSGRRVKTLKKGGAYIKNGQKFIIK